VFKAKGAPAVRFPLVLDAAPAGEGSTKGWAAAARGAAAAGAPLMVTPAQLKARGSVLKASGVPLLVRFAPGDALSPEIAASSGALLLALSSDEGAPAVLAPGALPALIEALRAVTEYRAPVALLAHPGRIPRRADLAAAAAAGACALGLHAGSGASFLPLPALLGTAQSARGAGGIASTFLITDEITDGVALAFALACGGGVCASAFPLRLALLEEALTDADWKSTGDRLGTALRVLWHDAQRASAAVGVRDPRDLSPENLRALTYDAAALSGVPLAGFDARLPWWAH